LTDWRALLALWMFSLAGIRESPAISEGCAPLPESPLGATDVLRSRCGLYAAHPLKRGGLGMPLIYVVLALIIVGMGLWLINAYIPMAMSIKRILNVVVVIAVCVWLLQITG